MSTEAEARHHKAETDRLGGDWQPTMELRRFDDTHKLTNPRLQQRWVRIIGFKPAEYEWRDVPLVWEPARTVVSDEPAGDR